MLPPTSRQALLCGKACSIQVRWCPLKCCHLSHAEAPAAIPACCLPCLAAGGRAPGAAGAGAGGVCAGGHPGRCASAALPPLLLLSAAACLHTSSLLPVCRHSFFILRPNPASHHASSPARYCRGVAGAVRGRVHVPQQAQRARPAVRAARHPAGVHIRAGRHGGARGGHPPGAARWGSTLLLAWLVARLPASLLAAFLHSASLQGPCGTDYCDQTAEGKPMLAQELLAALGRDICIPAAGYLCHCAPHCLPSSAPPQASCAPAAAGCRPARCGS